MTSKQNTTVRIVITESERDPHGEALYEHWRVSAGGPIDDSGPRSAKEDTKQPLGTSVDTMRSRTVPDTTGSTIIDSRVDGTSLKNTEIRRDTLRPVEKISQGQAEVTFTDPDQISNTDDDSSYNNERVTSPSAVSDSGSDIDDVRGNAEAVMYLKACALYRVTPSYHFRQCVSDLDVSMQHRTLGDVGIKAIATALVVHTLRFFSF
ncbi:hypothetical protein DPMN_113385 [Dreissena polymorpha]|uniref:Uncharacterized protein n=1 Tax=Dreissena polymorpha TaxID=45954 RepID=A0A9D4KHD1_DREPO|nr:hypothetical protein DPMN_113385 [Dreissena polymorpha]